MRVFIVSRKKHEEVVAKLEDLLCYATGGRLSKSSYPIEVMKKAVREHIRECRDEEALEALREYEEKAKTEIERLKKENESFSCLGKLYSEIKSEARKEFAERLKALFGEWLYSYPIDELLAEMEERE